MAETLNVECDVESTNGDSDYCPSNDGSYSESSADRKQPRKNRKRSAEEAESRTLMRPWLIDLINSGRIPELYWQDTCRSLVHIPWLHASRHTFDTDKDSTLFKLWAEHSGKYVPGQDEPEPKRWKANFRCAINSLSDVHEVKCMSCKKGLNAFKVYCFDADMKHAKKRPSSSNGHKAVVNANRKEMIKARKIERASKGNGPAVAKWLNQQQPEEYSDIYNEVSQNEFGESNADLSVLELEVAYEETVVSNQDFYLLDNLDFADIPLPVAEYSRRTTDDLLLHTTEEVPSTTTAQADMFDTPILCSFDKDTCLSPAGSDTHSVDSGLSDSLTDEGIAEMVDEWQSETGQLFLELTSVEISEDRGNDYSCLNTPIRKNM